MDIIWEWAAYGAATAIALLGLLFVNGINRKPFPPQPKDRK